MAAEWPRAPLRDLIQFTRDGEWGSDQPSADSLEMLVVRGTDFARLRVGALAEIPRRYIERGAAERKQLQAGDVLIETAGGTKEQSTGRTALVKQGHIERSGLPLTCASFARFLRFDRARVDPGFMYWWLQGLHTSGEMERHQVQHTGVARFQFTRFVESTEAPLPLLSEQRAIAHILGALDDKIELNRRMNETLEAMARALFNSWFVDFDPVRAKAEGRDPGLPQPLADLFPDSFEDSELGEIPKGWEVGKLGDRLEQRVERCAASAETAARPYVPIDCISSKSLFLTESKPGKEAQSSLTKFYKGDLLFGAMRPYFHKVCIAPFDGTTRTTAFVLFTKKNEDFGFAALLLHRPDTIDYATRHSTGSTIPYAIWSTSLEDMPVIVPPSGVRKAFDGIVRPLLMRIPEQYPQNMTLAALRDTLLPKLISGEVRVKDAERFIRGGD